MKKKQQVTAFYLETLLMIAVFVTIILVLTRVFGSARVRSLQAKRLTDAVTLAQSTAEAVSASKSPGELRELLDGGRNVVQISDEGGGVTRLTAAYDAGMEPVPLPDGGGEAAGAAKGALPAGTRDMLTVVARWQQPEPGSEEEGIAGVSISVYGPGAEAAVYTLDTAVCTR